MESDSFFTIQTPAIGEFKDRGSKFIGFAYPVETVEACIVHLQSLKKEHFKANHHCFAFRIGANGYNFRINDDGEPSGTAGKPILGQIDSNKLTNILVVVVRYFGGTLLGTSGLINAYRQTTAIALKNAIIIEKIIEEQFELTFNYSIMPDVMNAVKKLNLPIIAQQFNENAALITAIRQRDILTTLTQLKAQIAKISIDEAAQLSTIAGLNIKPLQNKTTLF